MIRTLHITFDAYKERRLKPLIPALGIPRQDYQEFEVSLGCVVRPCLLLHPLIAKNPEPRFVCGPVLVEKQSESAKI